MSRRRVAILALVAAALATTLALAASEGTASASAPNVPLPSSAPGSPIFVSFRPIFEPSRHTTSFEIMATGEGLAHVWSLEGQSCGTLVDPAGRTPRNGYFHRDCAFDEETAARVSVLVARAADLGSDGRPRSDDVTRFVYSQVVRAGDSPDTQGLDPKPRLQYFGPPPVGPPVPTTTPPAAALVPSPAAVAAESPAVADVKRGELRLVDLAGPIGGLIMAILVVLIGERGLSGDLEGRLDQLCARARVELDLAEREAADTQKRLADARGEREAAATERERIEHAAAEAEQEPREGDIRRVREDSGREFQVSERDRMLREELYAEARARRTRGEIRSEAELQRELARIRDIPREELRERDRERREAARSHAGDELAAAREREERAVKLQASGEIAAASAEAARASAARLASAACALADLEFPPERPPELPPPPPLRIVRETATPEPVRACCEDRIYLGYVRSYEQSSLPIVTKVISLIRGVVRYVRYGPVEQEDPVGWFTTGFDYWSGRLYCASDPSKFARFEAKAARTGLGIGGGGGITVIYCSGYDHPESFVEQIPSMMSGWNGDVSGVGTAYHAVTTAGQASWRLTRPVLRPVLRELGELAAWAGLDALKSLVSSAVQGARGCRSMALDLTMQIGIWRVSVENVTKVVREYGCCSNCGEPVVEDVRAP